MDIPHFIYQLIFCLSVMVSLWGYYEQCCYEHLCTNFFMDRVLTTGLLGNSPVVSNILTKLCSHHHYLIPEHFHHLKRNIVPISSQCAYP